MKIQRTDDAVDAATTQQIALATSHVAELKKKVAHLEEQLKAAKTDHENKQECLQCEITVLNEVIEAKDLSSTRNVGNDPSSPLAAALEEITNLNTKMLQFLKNSKIRRIKNESPTSCR